MVTLAFYRAKGRAYDGLIRWWTGSIYSHVEMIRGPIAPGDKAVSWSASPRDGGVRGKEIRFGADTWDLVPVEWAPITAIDRIIMHNGAAYDWPGILFSQILPLKRHSKPRWFCSEICAMALGLPEPHQISPGALKAYIDRVRPIPPIPKNRFFERPIHS